MNHAPDDELPDEKAQSSAHPTLHLNEYTEDDLPPVPPIATGAKEQPPARPMLGRYEVVGSLGVGGMADVLLVTDEKLGRELAAKVLRQGIEADPGWMDKFLLEAQVCGQLEHPNIVPVHDLDLTEDGRLFFTMKRVQGEDLDQLLRRIERTAPGAPGTLGWPLSRLLEVFIKCCDAIDFAHSHGVIHRDLKPANVMIGRFGEVLVMDWGLAKPLLEGSAAQSDVCLDTSRLAAELTGHDWLALREPEQTQYGVVIGTPAYMPPEQAAGDPLDRRADIYSLGAILYEILTLRAPYDAVDPYDLLEKLQAGPPPTPSERAPERQIPWELEAVVQHAMARQPRDRYQSVAELKADIKAYLSGRTLQAAEYAVWQRLLKWLRRHRAASIAVAAVLLISLAIYWGIQRQHRLQQAHRLEQQEALFLRQVERLELLRAAQVAAVARLSGPGARRLVEPNGELARDAVADWYRTHSDAVETLQRLARLASRAPTPASRASIDLAAVDRQLQRLTLSAAYRAAELGDDTLAQLWLRRATASGLGAAAEKEARDQIERARKLRITGMRYAARQQLLKARKVERPGNDWYQWALASLLRNRGPELARLLLDPEHLDSRHPWERRLTIEALGRLGDTRTLGPEGTDPVLALSKRLADCSLQWELERAVQLATALGFLQDPRAYEVLAKARAQAGVGSTFWVRTQAAFLRIRKARQQFGR